MYVYTFILIKWRWWAIDINTKSHIVHGILNYIKHGELTNNQKQTLYDIVMKLESKTELQKERFIMFYKLNPVQKEKYTLSSLAQFYNCTVSAVRCSIVGVITAIINRTSDEDFNALESIFEECKK